MIKQNKQTSLKYLVTRHRVRIVKNACSDLAGQTALLRGTLTECQYQFHPLNVDKLILK